MKGGDLGWLNENQISKTFKPIIFKTPVGGITEPDRIRCLHTWYAAHLVRSNSVGGLIEEILDKGEYLATR